LIQITVIVAENQLSKLEANGLCMSSGTYTHFQISRTLMCHCLYTVLVPVIYLFVKKMIHILPINDLKEHTEQSTCDCKPKVITENGELICIHNAFDGRQFKEQLLETINKN